MLRVTPDAIGRIYAIFACDVAEKEGMICI